ncbi:SGNH/GDSL hydrolase family protein [Oribacterium sp. P6A1]|uniref:SGNH/GDSL hydrolase family protein n=1 Tax=Oribacterium sp. P6A1 TaxID=1410612 RepID=UPI0012DE1B56|nr:SGNH/GDSL hydrolase family protein [Oribacterium sp. P6A1]
MSSNDNKQTNDTPNLNLNEPLTEKEAASGRPKTLLVILILLILTITGVFGYMVNVAMKEDALDQSVAAERMDEDSKRLQPETVPESSVDLNEALSGSSSLFKKLTASEPVKILVIGDTFGTGAGAQDGTNWTELLADSIKEDFGSEVSVNNLSLANGNDAYGAYVSLMNEAAGNKDAVYDAVIVSLGYYDDPFNFGLQYEGILRSIRRCYGSAEIIGIIESASVTATEGYSDETALYARNLLEHYGGIVANMGEAYAVSGMDAGTLTSDGVLPNAAGQKIYADWIVKKIKNKLDDTLGGTESQEAVSQQPASGSEDPVNPDAELYDHYYYIEASEFYRADDVNYLINISRLKELGVENVGMLGIDYEYVEGKNTVQVVIDKNIFTGWNTEFEGTAPERHIRIVNNNAAVYDELAVSFATKEQADAFHGLILTGNLNLHQSEEKYDKLPMPPETTAPETEPETEAETEESVVETAAASDESKAEKSAKADSGNKKKEEESAKNKETRSSEKKKDDSEKKSSNSKRTSQTPAQQTAAPETAAVTVAETAAVETTQDMSQQVVETAAAVPTVPGVEGAVISDPADSANVSPAGDTYTVQAGQGIDINQWNSIGPTVG